jgi:hypothetical protein
MRKPTLKVKKVTFYQFAGPELAIAREEKLAIAREESGISRETFCLDMGHRWYPLKLFRMENRPSNTVSEETINQILNILGQAMI